MIFIPSLFMFVSCIWRYVVEIKSQNAGDLTRIEINGDIEWHLWLGSICHAYDVTVVYAEEIHSFWGGTDFNQIPGHHFFEIRQIPIFLNQTRNRPNIWDSPGQIESSDAWNYCFFSFSKFLVQMNLSKSVALSNWNLTHHSMETKAVSRIQNLWKMQTV